MKDNKGNINNIIDWRNQNKIIIPDIKIYRKELNFIKNFFKDKQSEIFIQKSNDIICIIRLIVESKSLINRNIEDKDILLCKNKILAFEEKSSDENENDNNDDENHDSSAKIITKSINFNFGVNKPVVLSRSFEENENKNNEIELNNSLGNLKKYNGNRRMAGNNNLLSANYKNKLMKYSSPNTDNEKEKLNYLKQQSSNNILEASMDVNLGNSNNLKSRNLYSSNNNNEYNNSSKNNIINEGIMNYYDGYAVICTPCIDNKKNNKLNKGEIIIPGKIIDLVCACYCQENNKEIYFTKDMNYLKCITSNISFKDNRTVLNFNNVPNNLGIIIKFKIDNSKKAIIDNLNKNIEILFNKGNEFINYFDVCDINKLLFKTENQKIYKFQ